MNNKLVKFVSIISAIALMTSIASAEGVTTNKDIPIGSSGEYGATVEMIGVIQPTIMSVTMPSVVPFNISNSVKNENKVISPRINVVNNSNIPVEIDVTYASVDLSKISNAYWSDNGFVGSNEIAIGLKEETELNKMPENLDGTNWIKGNKSQHTKVLTLNSNGENAMYVVGRLGSNISESSTFSVIPTFVARKAY